VIGGIDDAYTKHADVPATLRAARRLAGAPLFLSHGPDVFPALPRGSSLLVGHTHCGQIVLPLLGPQLIPSRYGSRYACGRYEEAGKTMIVSGGVGTSVLPLRLGAPPDYWLITIRRAKAVK
jgi:predicted MPP superfamily phosphohydrolase